MSKKNEHFSVTRTPSIDWTKSGKCIQTAVLMITSDKPEWYIVHSQEQGLEMYYALKRLANEVLSKSQRLKKKVK